jgi:hypothetical protein
MSELKAPARAPKAPNLEAQPYNLTKRKYSELLEDTQRKLRTGETQAQMQQRVQRALAA